MQSKFFNTPFATAGDKIDIPDAAQVDGSVSFATGFGPDYEKELGVDPDAKPVPRDATNGVLYDITDALGAIQKQGAPQFIEAADNGGAPFSYGRGVRVMYGTPARPWVSRVDNNTTTHAAGANWQLEVFEAATNAQAIAGTDPAVLITPPGLKAALEATVVTVPDATETVKGIQRNATQAEANGGSPGNATITAATLAPAVANMVPAATTMVAGRVFLATAAEATAQAVSGKAVSPLALTGYPRLAFVNTFSATQNIVVGPGALGLDVTMGLSRIVWGPYGSGNVSMQAVDSGNTTRVDFDIVCQNLYLRPLAGRVFCDGPLDISTAVGRFVVLADGGQNAISSINAANSAVTPMRLITPVLTVTGAVVANGGFQNGSSRTVKDHVADVAPADALRNVLALRGVLYRYHGSDDVRAGYYAEEVREARPEAVTDAEVGSFSPLLLEDAQMLPDHTGAIQELYRMIVELQEKQK